MWETIKEFLIQIWEVLKAIGDGVVAAVEYIYDIVSDILYITLYIGNLALSGITNWFSWMPSWCGAAIIVCIGVAVIYKILGRE